MIVKNLHYVTYVIYIPDNVNRGGGSIFGIFSQQNIFENTPPQNLQNIDAIFLKNRIKIRKLG